MSGCFIPVNTGLLHGKDGLQKASTHCRSHCSGCSLLSKYKYSVPVRTLYILCTYPVPYITAYSKIHKARCDYCTVKKYIEKAMEVYETRNYQK